MRVAIVTFTKECRCLVRDQHTLIYSVFVPVFLYPFLVWVAIQSVAYLRGVEENEISRVRLVGDGIPAVDRLRERLGANERVTLLETDSAADAAAATSETEARAEIARDRADAWVLATPAPAAIGDIALTVLFASVRDRSVRAKDRLSEVVEEWKTEELRALAAKVGAPTRLVDSVDVSGQDRSTTADRSQHLISRILPLLMLVMTALGALYPALDVTVGERERGSLETTLLSPVARGSIVAGKFLAVVLLSFVAFILNAASLSFTLVHQASLLKLSAVSMSVGVLLVVLLAAVLLSVTFSALMMFLAFQAQTFKEGQSYVMPVYVLAAVPALFLTAPEISATPALACVPLVNIALLFREAIDGEPSAAVVAITFGTSLFYVGIVLALAAARLRRSEVVAGGVGWGRWRRRAGRANAFGTGDPGGAR